MRLFIGMSFPEDIKTMIDQLNQQIHPVIDKGKWTSLDNLHLTLVFIGDVNEDQMIKIKDIIDQTLHNETSFEINIGNLDTFQKGHQAIVWLGIYPPDRLVRIASTLKYHLKASHLPFDHKPFNPHITLVRQAVIKKDMILPKPNITDTWKVDGIHLYLSHHVEGILTYTKLYTIKLK